MPADLFTSATRTSLAALAILIAVVGFSTFLFAIFKDFIDKR